MWKYGALHVTLLSIAYGYLGWGYGTLFLVVFVNLMDVVLDKAGIQRMNYGDALSTYELEGVNHNIGGYFIIERITFEEFQRGIYERGISKIRKLRMVLKGGNLIDIGAPEGQAGFWDLFLEA